MRGVFHDETREGEACPLPAGKHSGQSATGPNSALHRYGARLFDCDQRDPLDLSCRDPQHLHGPHHHRRCRFRHLHRRGQPLPVRHPVHRHHQRAHRHRHRRGAHPFVELRHQRPADDGPASLSLHRRGLVDHRHRRRHRRDGRLAAGHQQPGRNHHRGSRHQRLFPIRRRHGVQRFGGVGSRIDCARLERRHLCAQQHRQCHDHRQRQRHRLCDRLSHRLQRRRQERVRLCLYQQRRLHVGQQHGRQRGRRRGRRRAGFLSEEHRQRRRHRDCRGRAVRPLLHHRCPVAFGRRQRGPAPVRLCEIHHRGRQHERSRRIHDL